MLNEKNIETLKSQLQSLGFAGGMEYELRSNICFQPNHFNVLYRQSKEGDTMNVILHFERHENIEYYSCRYYDACLRKKIEIPTIKLNEIDTKDLEEKMTLVNWNFSYVSNHANKAGRENHLSWEREEAVERIIIDLKKLATTNEGAIVAECLKMKFWVDTPLESYISNIGAQKNLYEISQRFYFFEGEDQITLDEAYRFLCNRWREKQLNARKKQNEPAEQNAHSDSMNGSTKENKLLPKKRRSKGTKFRL